MNLQHLEYFQAICEEGNFSKAAKQLYITPSALSKAINTLESELGFPLFRKEGRNSVLTEYGEAFLIYVRKATNDIQEGLDTVHSLMNNTNESITLSGIYTMCTGYLPDRINSFQEWYPKVKFVINYHVTEEILEELKAGKCELGFCGDFNQSKEKYRDLKTFELMRENLFLAVPLDHKLAEDQYVDFSKLADEKFISWKKTDSGINAIFTNLCKEAGIIPHVSYEAPDDNTVLGLIKAGLGISLIPDSPYLDLTGLKVLKFKDNIPYRKQYVVWNKNHYLSLAAKTFLEYIIDETVEARESSCQEL